MPEAQKVRVPILAMQVRGHVHTLLEVDQVMHLTREVGIRMDGVRVVPVHPDPTPREVDLVHRIQEANIRMDRRRVKDRVLALVHPVLTPRAVDRIHPIQEVGILMDRQRADLVPHDLIRLAVDLVHPIQKADIRMDRPRVNQVLAPVLVHPDPTPREAEATHRTREVGIRMDRPRVDLVPHDLIRRAVDLTHPIPEADTRMERPKATVLDRTRAEAEVEVTIATKIPLNSRLNQFHCCLLPPLLHLQRRLQLL